MEEDDNSSLVIGAIMLLIIGFFVFLNYRNDSKISIVNDCKVKKLIAQNKVSGSSKNLKTEIRYLVITDKETFICESSVFNSKYNNSDIFYSLEEGKTYTFRVSGQGKSAAYDYRNILEVVK